MYISCDREVNDQSSKISDLSGFRASANLKIVKRTNRVMFEPNVSCFRDKPELRIFWLVMYIYFLTQQPKTLVCTTISMCKIAYSSTVWENDVQIQQRCRKYEIDAQNTSLMRKMLTLSLVFCINLCGQILFDTRNGVLRS